MLPVGTGRRLSHGRVARQPLRFESVFLRSPSTNSYVDLVTVFAILKKIGGDQLAFARPRMTTGAFIFPGFSNATLHHLRGNIRRGRPLLHPSFRQTCTQLPGAACTLTTGGAPLLALFEKLPFFRCPHPELYSGLPPHPVILSGSECWAKHSTRGVEGPLRPRTPSVRTALLLKKPQPLSEARAAQRAALAQSKDLAFAQVTTSRQGVPTMLKTQSSPKPRRLAEKFFPASSPWPSYPSTALSVHGGERTDGASLC